jgi:hypothetical protein
MSAQSSITLLQLFAPSFQQFKNFVASAFATIHEQPFPFPHYFPIGDLPGVVLANQTAFIYFITFYLFNCLFILRSETVH